MPGITVGIDGSAHSTRALEWAIKEAAVRHAPVTVLTVHSVPASGWTGNPITLPQDAADQEQARLAAEEMTLKAMSQLGEAQPSSVTVRAVTGFPAQELIEASRTADLVVVGSRGAGGFARLLVGSVSSQVVHHAHCPVVVMPSES
jgi:nucleotide-binding universal stress UspA family protein